MSPSFALAPTGLSEAYASALVGVKVGIHPIDIADFITGIFFFDLKNDDIKLKLY